MYIRDYTINTCSLHGPHVVMDGLCIYITNYLYYTTPCEFCTKAMQVHSGYKHHRDGLTTQHTCILLVTIMVWNLIIIIGSKELKPSAMRVHVYCIELYAYLLNKLLIHAC